MAILKKSGSQMWTETVLQFLNRRSEDGADIATVVAELFLSLAKESRRLLPAAHWSCVRIFEEKDGTLRFSAVDGEGWPTDIAKHRRPIDQKSAGAYAIQSKKPFVIKDVRCTEHFHEIVHDVRSHVSVPIFWRRQAAVLSLDSPQVGAFSESDLSPLQELIAPTLTVLEHLALKEDKWFLELRIFSPSFVR